MCSIILSYIHRYIYIHYIMYIYILYVCVFYLWLSHMADDTVLFSKKNSGLRSLGDLHGARWGPGRWNRLLIDNLMNIYPLVNNNRTMDNHHFLMGKSTINSHFQELCNKLPEGNLSLHYYLIHVFNNVFTKNMYNNV